MHNFWNFADVNFVISFFFFFFQLIKAVYMYMYSEKVAETNW